MIVSQESQYVFNDGEIKSRLIRHARDWFVAEWKSSAEDDGHAEWMPWICGTRRFLDLNDVEVSWARLKKGAVLS